MGIWGAYVLAVQWLQDIAAPSASEVHSEASAQTTEELGGEPTSSLERTSAGVMASTVLILYLQDSYAGLLPADKRKQPFVTGFSWTVLLACRVLHGCGRGQCGCLMRVQARASAMRQLHASNAPSLRGSSACFLARRPVNSKGARPLCR